MLEKGDLRVWWNTNGYNEFHNVDSIGEAIAFLKRMAGAEVDDPNVGFNAGGMEEFDPSFGPGEKGWTEWYDDDTGMDITELTWPEDRLDRNDPRDKKELQHIRQRVKELTQVRGHQRRK